MGSNPDIEVLAATVWDFRIAAEPVKVDEWEEEYQDEGGEG